MSSRRLAAGAVATLLALGSLSRALSQEYPGKDWKRSDPEKLGLDPSALRRFSDYVGGRGCVTRHGYLVHTWGDGTRRADVASASKPFYTFFLFLALHRGRIQSLDEKVVKWEPRLGKLNPKLGYPDRDITWRHLANQTSCYGLAERPGTAFAYNDWQMALFWDTLFLKVYKTSYDRVDREVFHPLLTDKIGCQDNPTMMAFGVRDRAGRVAISPRDFARFGLLYMRRGKWQGKQLLPAKYVEMAVSDPVPNTIPRAGRKAADMIPGQRSHGSERIPDNQTPHFGSYSWLWWTNGKDADGVRMWPDAPPDTFGAFGHGGPRAMWVVPSLGIVVSYNDARIRGWRNGKKNNPTNEAMRLLVASVRKR
ncbi:MAG: hypothetical protein KatS3mg105_1261 [Gemmatales bacterium]|nr:MAG: hypothetical protein KatS3mg105_1261 [Gemmatales bacterium]